MYAADLVGGNGTEQEREMDAEAIKRASKRYRQATDAVEDVIHDVMCGAYQSVTGKPASDRLREALYEAIRFNI